MSIPFPTNVNLTADGGLMLSWWRDGKRVIEISIEGDGQITVIGGDASAADRAYFYHVEQFPLLATLFRLVKQ